MKLYNSIFASAALGVTALLTQNASAQHVDNIGTAGQIVISAERMTGLFFNRLHVEDSDGDETDISYTSIALFGNQSALTEGGAGSVPLTASGTPRLGFDFLVTDGLTLGLAAMYLINTGGFTETAAGNQDLPTESLLILSPRIGYAYPFDDTVGIWPRVGFTWVHAASDLERTQGGQTITRTNTANATALTLDGMLVVSPFSHFAFVGGPFLDLGLGGSLKQEQTGNPDSEVDIKYTSFGLSIGIAGYF